MNMVPPKIIRPQLSSVYKRKRLFCAIDSVLKDSALWITSPPGAGKTTLVNSYIESKKLKCIWYRVDASDTDVASLFHYLGLASDAIVADKGRPQLPHLRPEHAAGIAAFTRQFFDDFFLRADKPFVLVFDSAQEASHDRSFAEAIRIAVESLPQGFKIIFISRTAPPPLLARSMVNRYLKALEWKDLKFDEAESIGLLQTLGHKKRAAGLAKKIHALAGGWASGLLLMSDRVDLNDVFSGVNSSGRSVELVFNYFMKEILSGADKGERAFLLKSSILPEMTVKAAVELTGRLEAGDLLSRLNGRNFFTEKAHDNKDVYRYHPLFRDFLINTLNKDVSEADVIALKAHGAALLENQGDIDNAALLYMDARRWNELVSLIKKQAPSLALQGRYAVLEGWIDSCPGELSDSEPWLRYWKGACMIQRNSSTARKNFEASYSEFKKNGELDGLLLSWCGAVSTYILDWQDFKPLDFWIEEMRAIIKTAKVFPSKQIEEAVYCAMFGALVFRQPYSRDMPVWEERVADICRSSGSERMRFAACKDLILFNLYSGNIPRARIFVDAIHRMADDIERPDFAQLMCLRSISLYYIYIGEFEKALSYAERGLGLADRMGIHAIDSLYRSVMIYAHLALKDVKAAEACLQLMFKCVKNKISYESIVCNSLSAIIASRKNEHKRAIEHMRAAFEFSAELGAPLLTSIYFSFYASSLLSASRYDDCEELIAKFEGHDVCTKSLFAKYHAMLIKSIVALNKGRMGAFEQELKNIFVKSGIAEFVEATVMCFYEISELSFFADKALDTGIAVGKISKFIRINRIQPPEGVFLCDLWPWPVKIQTFGRFAIYKYDKQITFERKVQKKPLDLLKALIALGGTDVSCDKLCDELWPDSDGDAAVKALRTNIHRLRQLIGEEAVLVKGSRLSLNSALCRVDALMFDSLALNAQRWLGSRENGREALQAIDNALEAYGRGFLPDDDNIACIAAEREHLRRKYQRISEWIAGYHDKKGDQHKAVSYYEKAFAVNKTDERLCRQLMQVYGRLRMQSKAGSAYKQLEAALKEESGSSVSHETVQTYKAATSDK